MSLKQNLNDAPDNNVRLSELADDLDEIGEALYTVAINLAMLGKWKKWDKTIPVGTIKTFTDEMLLETGDKLVTRVVQLARNVLEMKEQFGHHLETHAI